MTEKQASRQGSIMSLPIVFLCHSSNDKPFVRTLAERLRSDRIDIWLDELEISVGESIHEKVNEGLKTSDFFVVVLSRASVRSRWVREELSSASSMEKYDKAGVFVLPLLLEDCDVPPLLRDRKYAAFIDSFESGYHDLLDAIRHHFRRRYPHTDILQTHSQEVNSIERLGEAIKDGNVLTVIDHIKNGGDLERRTKDDWTPLHLACLYGKNFIGLLLMEAGAEGKAIHLYENNHSVTPLGFAVRDSYDTGILVDQLIKRSCLPRDNKNRKHLLLGALDNGNLPAARLLIAAGVEMEDYMWDAALSTGNKSGYGFKSKPFVRELKRFLKDFEESREVTILREKSQYEYDSAEVVRQVLGMLNADGEVDEGRLEHHRMHQVAVKLAQEIAIDCQKRGQEGGDLSKDEFLVRVVERGDFETTRRLLASQSFSDEAMLSAVYYATQENHSDVVRLLVARGIDLNRNPPANIPPLHRAAYDDLRSVASVLLRAGG